MKALFGLLIGTLARLPTTDAVAQPQAAVQPSADSLPSRGPKDQLELEAFFDGVMGAEMSGRHIAGGMVAVVKDGSLFFAKGYGYADVDARKPVDPERTLFRPGSVSKLFTWTAVMQLVEQGKLDLDRDVNEYLDFKIPATFSEPITMRHLLTHTLGVEEEPRGLINDDSTSLRPMGEWLPAHMPKRVRPPGTFSSYSNWGTAVAGYIVERVSGEPFPKYIQKHILDPLGMVHTTAEQPIPAALAPDMSIGYEWRGGKYVAHGFEYLPGAGPAGMISGSATDMARFMIAHLNEGQFGDQRILTAASARQMHARAFGHDDQLPGFGLGFYEKNSHGLRIIGHGGDSQWFHTDMALIPSERLGVYVSFNTNTSGEVSGRSFLERFLDHYYPETLPRLAAESDGADLARFAGLYRSNRRSYTTYIKAFELPGGTEISVGDSGTLVMSGGDPMHLARVGPMLFRNVIGNELVAFRADSAGRVTHFFTEEPMIAFERQAWYESASLHYLILGGGAVLFLIVAIGWLARLFRTKRAGRPAAKGVALTRRLLIGVALTQLAFLVSLLVLGSDFVGLVFGGKEGKVKIVLGLAVIGSLLTVGAVFGLLIQWKNREGTAVGRLGYSLVIAWSVLFVWSLNQWNLLGWRM